LSPIAARPSVERQREPDDARQREPDDARQREPDDARQREPDDRETMTTGGRWDGLQTFGLCAVLIAGLVAMDAGLERWLVVEEAPQPGTTAREEHRGQPVEEIPDVVITGFQFLNVLPRPEARPVWHLTASTALLFETRQEAALQKIAAAFEPEQESARMVLTSEQGRIDLKRMNFEVRGRREPVTMQLAGRYQLTTTMLAWNNAAERLTSDQPVTITGEGLTVRGVGFEWSQTAGMVSIQHDVNTTITP
jgi:LPS export ABC transporter protein LptC